ncbi:hypothetical protein LUU34_00195300 [Aix galericulata]|nr:hypothetical protein LUU34_00195300 [Aix galericulata]
MGEIHTCCTCDLPPPFLGWLLSRALQSLFAGCQPCPTACSPRWVTSTTEQLWMPGAAPQGSPRTHTGRANAQQQPRSSAFVGDEALCKLNPVLLVPTVMAAGTSAAHSCYLVVSRR